MIDRFKDEAKGRQGTRTDLTDNIQGIIPGSYSQTRDKLASLAGTNPHYITDAQMIKIEGPGQSKALDHPPPIK